MLDHELLAALLDSLKDPLLFADTGHTIRYMNQAATRHYKEGTALLGRSLMACHNADSQQVIRDVLVDLAAGQEERMITDNAKHRIFMRAVRDPAGRLLGYYERYQPPTASPVPAD
jgi:DUF438 domain-containing protein